MTDREQNRLHRHQDTVENRLLAILLVLLGTNLILLATLLELR